MAIQKNTAIIETVVRGNGYEFHLLNECTAPEDVRNFERPGMMTIKLSGVRLGTERSIGFVNDLSDPTNTPSFW